MNHRLLAMAIVLALSVEACTSPYILTNEPQEKYSWQPQYASYDELMAKAEGKTVFIFMKDRQQVYGSLIEANADSIAWRDSTTRTMRKVPTSQIDRLELYHNYWWQGMALGFSACTIPLVWAGAWAPGRQGNSDTPDYTGRTIVYLGAAVGIVVGGITGAAITHTDKFQTEADSTRSAGSTN